MDNLIEEDADELAEEGLPRVTVFAGREGAADDGQGIDGLLEIMNKPLDLEAELRGLLDGI